MAKLGIWFTQGYSNLFHALNDIRSADVDGRFKLLCSHPHPQFVGGEAADVRLVEPSGAKDSVYLDFVTDVVRRHDVRVIVPSRKQAFFNRHASLLRQLGVEVATVASTAMLARIDNKGRLYSFLKNKGVVRIPAFHCFQTVNEFDAGYQALQAAHPRVCVKPTRGVYGSGFRVLKAEPATLGDLLNETLTMPVQDLRARIASGAGQEMMVMQYLDGAERSVDCVAFKGALVGAVTRRKSPSAVGAQVIEDNPALVEQVERLVKLLKLNGLFNVQFKDHQGAPYLLEINTRLSGRAYYATVAGLNLPYVASCLFSGVQQPGEIRYAIAPGMQIGNVSSPVVLPGDCSVTQGDPARESL